MPRLCNLFKIKRLISRQLQFSGSSLMNKTNNDNGVFVISIDFELLWGVWDVTTREKYGNHIRGVKVVIPKLLELFEEYNIKATFATVGFLFAKNKDELLTSLPAKKPAYSNPEYNVYQNEFNSIGNDETDDPYHFGFDLFEKIKRSRHEMASHSFSHYYCLEEGQDEVEFDADIKAAVAIASKHDIVLKSFVFPRNQVNREYLEVLKNNGIRVYRGNPTSWIYKPRKFAAEVLFIRFCRLIDTYFPISGYNTHSLHNNDNLPVNIPASRFLKPYDRRFRWLENLKMNRIKTEMTKAAQKKQLYHLWWHPHNFGINLEENIFFLTELLKHYQFLNKQYGFSSKTMLQAAETEE